MAKIIYAPAARDDIKVIGRFTLNRWGKAQRNKYLNQLESRIIDLSKNPEKGRVKYKLKNSPLSYREGRHVIFYKKTEKGIEIIRILHEVMDFPRHF